MHRHARSRPACWVLCLFALALSVPAAAQFKIVNRDGTVTYTDRQPTSSSNARVTQLGRSDSAAAPDIVLPTALRQVVQRYPVTLFAATACVPCDAARQYLQQRGIPYSERRVVSDDDVIALERIVGGRTVPALTIGAQSLSGYSEPEWAAYLDAAGYPRTSLLPHGWQPPAPAPVVEERTAARAPTTRPPAPVAPARSVEPATESNPAGLRF